MLAATYDYRLVAFSVIIAIAASYAALDLAERVTAHRGRTRLAWLLGGAFAMGSGIWSMHYVGMLALSLPIPVSYHVPTVAFSLLAAVFASLTALYVVSREQLRAFDVAVGSLLMGAGIATMHYTGMAAMRLAAMHRYQHGLWLLSILLAVLVSYLGMSLISYSRKEDPGWSTKCAIAIVVGLAIPVMHYTGMAAVSFMPTQAMPNLSHSVDISALATFAIIVVTFVILAFSVATSLVDRRINAQQVILNNERNMLRALIDNIPDMMFVKDLEGRFLLANTAMARVAGAATHEALLGKTAFEFLPADFAETSHDREQGVMRSGMPSFNREQTITHSSGKESHFLMSKAPLRDANGKVVGIAAVGRDISDRTQMESTLREAERKYRGLFDDAIVGIFQSTPEGRLLSVNPAMARIYGYDSPEEMMATVTEVSRLYVEPKQRDEFKARLEKEGSAMNFEYQAYRRDETTVWVNLGVRSILENGEVIRYEGMVQDVTERKMLHQQLLQAQKLESIGQLAAGIAHEINTPTQYIGDNIRFLSDAFRDLQKVVASYGQLSEAARSNSISDETMKAVAAAVEAADVSYLMEEIPKAIGQSLDGVTQVSTLVSAMKNFSHPGVKDKTPVDLNRAIESTITIARNEWKYVADMETDFDPSLPRVSCLPGELNQVVLNMIVNAAHAIGDVVGKEGSKKGKIRVQTRNSEGWAEIRIQDTGSGIPEKARPRIFEPFFTTKEIGKGTGQGLAIARSVIVDKHAGSIHFETELGKGTTFIIRIPHDGKSIAKERCEFSSSAAGSP